MKILAPFSRKEEVLPLIDSGADELYCGIVPHEWENKYSMFDTLNRREGHGANFLRFADLQYSIQLAHKRNAPVFVTMNGLYTREQYPLIQKIVKKLKDIKVDGLIIADIGLLLTLQRTKFFKEIHMGTGGTAFNSRTINFFKKLGVSRIILDRHLTIGEIKDISQKNSSIVDLEVFILNTLCQNVDGFCTFYHGLPLNYNEAAQELDVKNKKLKFLTSYDVEYGGYGCVLKYKERIFDSRGKKLTKRPISIKRNTKQNKKGWKDCGACAMFDFNKIGITALKIVERGMPIESKIKDTQFIRKVLDILNKEKNLSRERFIIRTRELYCYTYKCDECSGSSCYYPSVFL